MAASDPSRCPKCGADGSTWSREEALEHLATCDGRSGGFRDRKWARDLLRMPKTQVSPTVRCVALAFMLCVDNNSLEGYAGQEALSKQTGYNARTVSRALVRLRALGWLKRVKRGRYTTHEAAIHRLTWPTWWGDYDSGQS